MDLSKLANNVDVACRLVAGVWGLVRANFDGVLGGWQYICVCLLSTLCPSLTSGILFTPENEFLSNFGLFE